MLIGVPDYREQQFHSCNLFVVFKWNQINLPTNEQKHQICDYKKGLTDQSKQIAEWKLINYNSSIPPPSLSVSFFRILSISLSLPPYLSFSISPSRDKTRHRSHVMYTQLGKKKLLFSLFHGCDNLSGHYTYKAHNIDSTRQKLKRQREKDKRVRRTVHTRNISRNFDIESMIWSGRHVRHE